MRFLFFSIKTTKKGVGMVASHSYFLKQIFINKADYFRIMIERKQVKVNNTLKYVLMGISIGSAVLSLVSVSISLYLSNKK